MTQFSRKLDANFWSEPTKSMSRKHLKSVNYLGDELETHTQTLIGHGGIVSIVLVRIMENYHTSPTQ